MRTLNEPRQPGMPLSADRHDRPEALAVLARANHDMRSPLTVISGVFELLAETASLGQGERRYLELGLKAANELLGLADALRLYAAVEGNLLDLDPQPVDLTALARDRLAAALRDRQVVVRAANGDAASPAAMADAGYLAVALDGLARHLAAQLPETDPHRRQVVMLLSCTDERGVTLQVATEAGALPAGGSAEARRPVDPHSNGLQLINGIRLIEHMGGSVALGDGPTLTVTLPAVAT